MITQIIISLLAGIAGSLVAILITKILGESLKVVAISAAIVFILAFILALMYTPRFILVTVPDVTGKSKDEAKKLFIEEELAYGEEKLEYSREPELKIVSQKPKGGIRVEEGTTVDVVISKGPRPLVVVPDVVGKTQTEATKMLKAKNFRVICNYLEYSMEPKSVVIGQEPKAEIKVEIKTFVYLRISEGLQPPLPISLSISEPQSGLGIKLTRHADNTYHFSVRGVSEGIANNSKVRLLLWVRPLDPPSKTPGYYLQRAPWNGVTVLRTDGSWEGTGQLGSILNPPAEGNTFSMAVTAVDEHTANDLLNQSGVVTHVDLSAISEGTVEVSEVRVEL